jgi:5'-nucleotidase
LAKKWLFRLATAFRFHYQHAGRDARGEQFMRILITNDDGIHAPGIAILARVALDLAGADGEVHVVAPDTERSGVSHAITLYRPLRLRQTQERWWACDGTPTDCVYLALNHMKLKPDVVLSGVNPGPNLGHDVLYSGTVAGAMEGAHWGVPALAISHCTTRESELAGIEPLLADILRPLIVAAQKLGGALNVNLPPVGDGPYRGTIAAAIGHRFYSKEVHARNDPRGRLYYWIGGAEVTMPDIPGSDCNAIRDRYVSVTPLGDDLTRHGKLSDLASQISAPHVVIHQEN